MTRSIDPETPARESTTQEGSEPLIKVLVCDHDTMFTDAVTAVITREPDLTAITCRGTVEDAIRTLEGREIDVMIVDSRLDSGRGTDVARWVQANRPESSTLILVGRDDDRITVDAYESGASAIVPKGAPVSDLVERIRDAHAGLRLVDALTARAARARLEAARSISVDGLDSVDREILRMLTDGSTDREIADRVHLNVQTIRNRVSRLLARYDKANRTQLAVMISRMAS